MGRRSEKILSFPPSTLTEIQLTPGSRPTLLQLDRPASTRTGASPTCACVSAEQISSNQKGKAEFQNEVDRWRDDNAHALWTN
jgi:hypothetical protein